MEQFRVIDSDGTIYGYTPIEEQAWGAADGYARRTGHIVDVDEYDEHRGWLPVATFSYKKGE